MEFIFTDREAWPNEALAEINTAASEELNRRRVLDSARESAEQLTIMYTEAIGRSLGDVWEPPTGAHDAYPNNFQVTHNDKLWVSTTPSNVWEPGVSGWREVVVEGGYPEWIQPTGSHDAYRVGDEVRFEGEVYVCSVDYNTLDPVSGGWNLKFPRILEWVQPTGSQNAYRLGEVVSYNGETYQTTVDWNVWEPGLYGWVEVEVPSEEDPEDPTPTDPEDPTPTDPEDPEPTVADFVQPTHAGEAYQIGDQVLFEGVVYESVMDNNTYSPSDYPAGWVTV